MRKGRNDVRGSIDTFSVIELAVEHLPDEFLLVYGF